MRGIDEAQMALVNRCARLLQILLEIIAALLVVTLTVIVLYAVITRYTGRSPSWYDEVASIVLVWLTYYAGALAALKRSHIGFDGFLMSLPSTIRLGAAIVAEIVVIGFFLVLAWTGLIVLQVLEGMTLISLRWVPVQLTQSVIPIGAALFILAELLSLPAYLAKVRSGVSLEHEEIQQAIADAEKEVGADAERILAGKLEKRRP